MGKGPESDSSPYAMYSIAIGATLESTSMNGMPIGEFEPGGYSRVLVRFYDTDGRAIAEIDGEISTDAGDTLRTVFQRDCACRSTCALIRDVYIPPEGWITLQPYRADGSVGDLSWLSTDEVDAGSNNPDKMWVNGGPVTDFLPGVPDILAFEIVAERDSSRQRRALS